MDHLAEKGIYNYRRLDDRLATSGQPTEEQLAAIAGAGFETVINLALHGTQTALADERASVERLGMTYVHIPVIWDRPTHADLETFFAAMQGHAEGKLYVHCAANMRVSSFMMLHRVLVQGWKVEDALPDVHAIWQPNATWQAFIDAELAAGGERA